MRAPATAPTRGRPSRRVDDDPATLAARPTGQGPTRSALRVTVLSTSHVARIGIRGLLATVPSRVTVVEESGSDRIARTDVTSLDVTIVDVAALNDPELLGTLERTIERSEAVVAMAAGFHPEVPTHLQGMGVTTCVSADISGPALVAVLESAAHARGATPALYRTPGLCRGSEASFLAGLSTREHHIIAKIAEGLSNQTIAQESFLSINTVKTYVRSAYRKLGITTRSEAVIWALREGIDYTPVEADRPRAVGA